MVSLRLVAGPVAIAACGPLAGMDVEEDCLEVAWVVPLADVEPRSCRLHVDAQGRTSAFVFDP